MATKKKLLEAAAGVGGAGGLNVEDVFSTYVYTGTSVNPNTITNGIDLAGEGGLVWLKTRTASFSHTLFDTERGVNKYLSSDATTAESTGTSVTSFNSDGFTLGTTSILYNSSSYNYASWTFRKAPKFFDVVTYTGNGNASQTISHSLGTTVGMLIIKKTSGTGSWNVYHRGTGNNKSLELQSTDAAYNNVPWGSVTSTTFEARSDILGNDNGQTYVAYLFAHNDGDGDFGSTADQDIIKCGSYTGNGSATGPVIDLGFEPQWILIKNATTGGTGWGLYDNMRGIATGGIDPILQPQGSGAEYTLEDRIDLTATGFKLTSSDSGVNSSGDTFIYIAIRRGPMAVPESATDVFAIDTRSASNPSFTSNFVTDFALARDVSTTWEWVAAQRLTQGKIFEGTNDTDAEYSSTSFNFDYQDGYGNLGSANLNYYGWMWKRAPSFFDVVAYTGNGVAGRTVSHNLGVAPEMIWVKLRNQFTDNWIVYHSSLPSGENIFLDTTAASSTYNRLYGPTDTHFTVSSDTSVNNSNSPALNYIAYLFASLDGVSKVGSYTGTGATLNIDCGFSSGARFVLIKRTDSTSPWWLWDSERGIVAGNDPMIDLNSNAGETTGYDWLDPYGSGFSIPAGGNNNISSGSYIYYAIA